MDEGEGECQWDRTGGTEGRRARCDDGGGVKVIGRRPSMAPYFTKERQSQVSEGRGKRARVTDVPASIRLIIIFRRFFFSLLFFLLRNSTRSIFVRGTGFTAHAQLTSRSRLDHRRVQPYCPYVPLAKSAPRRTTGTRVPFPKMCSETCFVRIRVFAYSSLHSRFVFYNVRAKSVRRKSVVVYKLKGKPADG